MRHRFTPPINSKRTMTKEDWAGWYQVTIYKDDKTSVRCLWWNGSLWNHAPNMRGGFTSSDIGDVRGIVHLVEA